MGLRGISYINYSICLIVPWKLSPVSMNYPNAKETDGGRWFLPPFYYQRSPLP
jgi:hypothetical protein